jgi:anti-sigma regulatory factor (Ser/Thr protein kinase)
MGGRTMPDNRGRSSTSDSGWSITMPSSLDGLKEGLNGLGSWLERHKVELETENRARLVFEEIVTNVIRYGFADSGEHAIHAVAEIGDTDLTLHFDDDGRPFDPRTAPAPAPERSLAQASIGGRGLMLVRAAARRIDYEHSGGRNRLTITLPRP